MTEIVRLKNVHKWFGDNHVLKGVDLSVQKGEIIAIIGQSGSGKSTALRCMDHLEIINEGEITVCGHSFGAGISSRDLKSLRLDVGIVFQSYNLFPHLTVEQNITLAPRSVRKISKEQARKIAADVLAKVGLSDKLAFYPEQLSGGQQQRVAIARSLAMDPKLMLFDEVTSALDPQLTGEVLRVIEKLAAGGMTMVLVTHEMAFAMKLAHRIIFMFEGKIHEQGTADILRNPKTPELQQFVSNGL
ncbi:MAG: amino acid ABC transporter ATP-binding protein [Castellaniella sp.]|uniref:amino acid ABC transporter ATP-binding protein n=1 Tax=Castellaniella sp. TaxID=1955812 RepID=UPI0011F6061A|nr:amino acid ABC transporter ATP-binding protein [Castellaniella sp.]TAN30847.1 MAG: amino acid ABC transporter ATP-binding protein [Castellaniella sp.]